MPDAEYKLALAQREAMKELAAEITAILKKVGTLGYTELCFLDDGITDRLIETYKAREEGNPVLLAEERILEHFTKFISGVKSQIAMVHNGNVSHQSTVNP